MYYLLLLLSLFFVTKGKGEQEATNECFTEKKKS